MRCPVVLRRNGSAKAVQVDQLITVVELEDLAHVLDDLEVLVTLRVAVVQ